MVMPSTETKSILNFPKQDSTIQKFHKFASTSAGTARSVLSATLHFTNSIPVQTISAIKATKLLAGVEVIMNIPKAINEGYTAANSKTSVDRISHSWKSVMAVSSCIRGVSEVLEAVNIFTPVAQNVLSLFSLASKFLYPFAVVDLINSTTDFAKFEDFYKDFRQNVQVLSPKAEKGMRVSVLTNSCNYIIENNNRIKKSFDIGDAAKIEARAQAVLEQIAKGDVDLDKSEGFVKTLQNRAIAKYVLDASSIVLKTAKVITIPFALFTPATPELLITVAAISVLQLAHLGVSTAVLTKNPFAESKISIKKPLACMQANVEKAASAARTYARAVFTRTDPLVCKA